MSFAIGRIVDGMAVGWEPAETQDKAIKQAYERSISDTQVHCIMVGESEDDENGEIAYLVMGGAFYKPHDL